MNAILPYIGIAALIAFSAFFSGSEIAYSSANRMRLKKAADEGGLRDRVAWFLYDNYDRALSTILIGNNLVNIAASSMATIIAIDIAGGAGAPGVGLASTIASLIMTVLILIFGEIAPKIIAKEHAEGFARGVALLLRFLSFLFFPAVWLVMCLINLISRLWKNRIPEDDSMTEDELVSIIETVEDEGVIDEERSDLLQSAIEFSEISAQEIITPRVDMLAIDIDDDINDIISLAYTSPHSRIPVYENTIDNIIGVLYIKHLLKKLVDTDDISVRDLLMDACFIHKSMKLPAVLAEMKKRKLHLAIVTDEYGGTMGLLTMEDVLEQLVGDIWDETDEIEEEFTEAADGDYIVSGDLGIYDFLENMDINEDSFEGDYTTLGGLAIDRLNGYPSPGDSFRFQNLTITVREMDEKRVTLLSVHKEPEEDEEE